jgi:hypothetical protein
LGFEFSGSFSEHGNGNGNGKGKKRPSFGMVDCMMDGWMLGLVARYPWVVFGLSFVELELDFPLCDERGGDER